MTINRFWISPALGVEGYGSWWEALFNLLALTLLCASLLYYLPYQVFFNILISRFQKQIRFVESFCFPFGGFHVSHL